MADELPPLPLIHDEDSYTLYLIEESEKTLRLTEILRYQYNLNGNPQSVSFRDLDPRAKDAVLRQIQRKYVGRSVLV